MKCPHCNKQIENTRTNQQSKSLWVFFTLLANELNDSGLDMRKVLKPEYNLPWTKDSVHDHLWIPIQKAMFGTKSTRSLKKHSEIDKIHEVLMRELGEKCEVDYIPFPSDPDKDKNREEELKPSSKLDIEYPEMEAEPKF